MNARGTSPGTVNALVGRQVTVWARRQNNNAYRSEPERVDGELIAQGRVFDGHRQPYALVLVTAAGRVWVITLARITAITPTKKEER
jgi:hypothetical protein